MINLLISLAAAAIAFVAVFVPFGWVAALLPGLAVGVAVYVLLARRTSKQLESAMPEIQKNLVNKRFDQAVAQLEALRPLGKWQFLVTPIVDAQIGMVLYAYKQQPDQAVPYLEKAYAKQWQAKAMLAAHLYKKKDYARMEKVFEEATKQNKKTSLLWSAWAWCEWKRDRKDKALEVLQEAQKHVKDDDRLKTNVLQLQNNKKMKMKGYAEEWWALLLERPPVQMMNPGGGYAGRGGRMPRRR